MRYGLLLVATLTWALWFGATISVFVFGWAFFRPVTKAHPVPATQATAGQETVYEPVRPAWSGDAANAMFHAYRGYEFAIGAVALLAAGLAFVTYPSRWTLGLLAGFIGASGMAIIFCLGFMPILDGLRSQGMTGSDDFKWRHGQSMITLAVQALILLVTGLLVPNLLSGKPRRPAPVEGAALAGS